MLAITDLSPTGNSAIPHAYGMLVSGGTVHLVHVRDRYLPDPIFPHPFKGGSIVGTPFEADLQQKLREVVPRDAEKYDLKTQIHIIDGGHIPTAILQTANRLGVDAICLATHGRTGLTKAVMGSVADEVVKGADCPVYLIRGQL